MTEDLAGGAVDELALSAEEAVDKGSGVDEAADEEAVHGDIGERAKGATFEAVRRNDGEEVFDLNVHLEPRSGSSSLGKNSR